MLDDEPRLAKEIEDTLLSELPEEVAGGGTPPQITAISFCELLDELLKELVELLKELDDKELEECPGQTISSEVLSLSWCSPSAYNFT